MTTPRHPRTLPALLALGLAAVVALPAASALQLASAGNAAADAAWTQAATLGGSGCAGEVCTAQYHEAARLANAGSASASMAWDLQAETHERETVDAAVAAAEELRAEAEAKLREALALKDRVEVDVRGEYHYDSDITTRGDAEAAWDTEATFGGDASIEGLFDLRGERQVDLEDEERFKAETEAKVQAEAEGALDMLADLLAEVQGQLTMTVDATFDAFADAGAAVQGALGLVQNTDVDVHHELDASVGLGTVPRVEVPDLRPDVGMAGSASVVAQAQAAAGGIVRG